MYKRLITPYEAINLLNGGNQIHTFRVVGNIMLGADWDREILIETIKANPDTLQLCGETARGMKHGLALEDDNGPLFIETNVEKLNVFDPL